MQKRHFEMIARVLKGALTQASSIDTAARFTVVCVIDMFAEELKEQNPRFDKQRFLAACGVK